MSSAPLKLGLIPSEQQNEEVIVAAAEVADLSLIKELAPPPSSSSSSSNLHNNNSSSSTNLDEDDPDGPKEEEEEELLQHFSHPHPLKLFFEVVVKEEEGNNNKNNDVQLTTSTVGGFGQKRVRCPGCRDDPVVVSEDDGPIYRCSLNPGAECEDEEDKEGFKFILHKSCAKLPLNMVSSVHPQHPLQLFPAYSCNLGCDICEGRILGFSYSCRPSDLDLHIKCAELRLQRKMVCTLHPQHLLQLLPPSPLRVCDLCGQKILRFSYSCGPCNLNLHIKCASLHKIEPSESHPHQHHSFILLKSTIFTCDACGVDEGKQMPSYLCTTCQFQVHTNSICCSSSYPLTLKQILHRHQLNLTYSHQLFELDFDFSHKLCMICNNKMNSGLYVYYCSPCAYFAHLRCATLEHLRDVHFENQLVATESETTNEFSRLGGSQEEDPKSTELQQQQQQLLPHFSHPHSLILSNTDEPDQIDQLCDACAWPLSVPFYTCPPTEEDQCNFSLHIQCATELRAEIQHPLHRHPLTLHAKHPENDIGLFTCHACEVDCNGFTYTCDECKTFHVCVRCSLFSDNLSHEGHQCPLNIMYTTETKCSACGSDCSCRFMCEECNFNLDLRCASLPKAIMHKCPKPDWAIRPLKLTYSSVEDENGEYYCDICEERRDQNHWFYYCEACDYYCHPRCVLGNNLVRHGKTYNFSIHPHPLTLVKKAKGRYTCVAASHNHCTDSPFLVCAECDFSIHFLVPCIYMYENQS